MYYLALCLDHFKHVSWIQKQEGTNRHHWQGRLRAHPLPPKHLVLDTPSEHSIKYLSTFQTRGYFRYIWTWLSVWSIIQCMFCRCCRTKNSVFVLWFPVNGAFQFSELFSFFWVPHGETFRWDIGTLYFWSLLRQDAAAHPPCNSFAQIRDFQKQLKLLRSSLELRLARVTPDRARQRSRARCPDPVYECRIVNLVFRN